MTEIEKLRLAIVPVLEGLGSLERDTIAKEYPRPDRGNGSLASEIFEHSTALASATTALRRYDNAVPVPRKRGRPAKGSERYMDEREALDEWTTALLASDPLAALSMPRLSENMHANVATVLRGAGIHGLPQITFQDTPKAGTALRGFLDGLKTRAPIAVCDELRWRLLRAFYVMAVRNPGFGTYGIGFDDDPRWSDAEKFNKHGKIDGYFKRFVEDFESAAKVRILGSSWDEWRRVWLDRTTRRTSGI